MGIERPEDPHLWLGTFLLSHAKTKIDHVALSSGEFLQIQQSSHPASPERTTQLRAELSALKKTTDAHDIASPERTTQLRAELSALKKTTDAHDIASPERTTQLRAELSALKKTTDAHDIASPERTTQLRAELSALKKTTDAHDIASPERTTQLRAELSALKKTTDAHDIAATKIQAQTRGTFVRLKTQLVKEKKRKDVAASKVQSVVRARQSRTMFKELQSEYMNQFIDLFEPLTEDDIDRLQPSDVVMTASAATMKKLSDDRWKQVFQDSWERSKKSYPLWANVLAEVDGDDEDEPDGVDEEDSSVKIKVYTEVSPNLPKIEGGAWWPIELLRKKPPGAEVDKYALHLKIKSNK
eukprot:g535.t1